MPLNLDQKKELVAELADVVRRSHSAVAAEYAGLTVEALTDLRRKARSSGVYLKVVKNTLVHRAVVGTPYECMRDSLTGPLVYAFSLEDPGAAGRLIKDFSKSNDKLKPHAVAIGGKLYAGTEVERLASLPTREQALSTLLGLMKAPAERLVRTIAEPGYCIARAIAAVADQKKAA